MPNAFGAVVDNEDSGYVSAYIVLDSSNEIK